MSVNPADCTGTDRLASPGPARRQPCPTERERESGAEGPPAGGASVEGVEGVGQGGASPARPAPSELSVSGSRREEVPGPAGARAGRPAQRETAHPARAEPAALGTRSSAAAAAPGSRCRARRARFRRRRARVQVNGAGVALPRSPPPRPSRPFPPRGLRRWEPGRSRTCAPAPPQAPVDSAAP